MTNPIPRLLDRLLPWRAALRERDYRIEELLDSLRIREEKIARDAIDISHLTRERDTARRQFAETKSVNLTNAAAHRATEVAMLRQNHALQVAEAQLAGRPVHPELAAAAQVPALRMPRALPVQQPTQPIATPKDSP